MENNFFMWGERGLVATFLLDLSCFQNQSVLSDILKEIELADGKRINFEPKKMRCTIEPDYGNSGFGHPDAIIELENVDNKKIIILFEAKTGSYKESSKNSSQRANENFNSSINGQLELNYCLSLALSNFYPENHVLEEPSWILNTRYNEERCDELRKVSNPNVIEKLVKPFISSDIHSYYHIILTNEDSNPLTRSYNLPELYDKDNINRWKDFKSNFGWVNYAKLKKIAEIYFKKGKFLDTFELNSKNMSYLDDPFYASRGTFIIYAPTVDDKVLFHLSWRGETSVLRNYKDKSSQPEEICCKTSEIKKEIKIRIIPEEIKPISEIEFWYNYIRKLKELNCSIFK